MSKEEKLKLKKLYDDFKDERKKDLESSMTISKKMFGSMMFAVIEREKIFKGTEWDITADVRSNPYVADGYSMLYFSGIGIDCDVTKVVFAKLKDLLPDMSYITVEMEVNICGEDVILHLFETDPSKRLTMYVKYARDEIYGSRRNVEGPLQLKITLEIMKKLGIKISKKSIDELKHARDKLMSEYEILFDKLGV